MLMIWLQSVVFKRFDAENMFQVACSGEQCVDVPVHCSGDLAMWLSADVVERFQSALFLALIFFQDSGSGATNVLENAVSSINNK